MKFSLTTRDTKYIEGFGTVAYTPNVLDPTGTMRVHCEKHDKWISVDFSLFDDGFVRGDKILQAFKNCPECLEAEEHKSAYKNTRWPEGAEI